MDGSDLYLEVFVNGASTELIAHFRRRADGSFAIDPKEMRNVGLAPNAPPAPDGMISLDRLAGIRYRYDEAAQSIHFDAADDARAPYEVLVGPPPSEEALEVRADWGSVLNYTLFASSGGVLLSDLTEFGGVSGALENRVFGPLGTLTNSAIASAFSSDRDYEMTRLDTTWSYSDAKRLLTYAAGDVISGGLAWTRPVRLGGVQVQRNFRLRPDLVTLPLPSYEGSAAVPSTLDVYLGDNRIYSDAIPAGPFVANDLPAVAGAGSARVVLTDALGRETVTELPFYVGSELLQHGLFDFSVEAGLPRRSFGSESWDYDEDWFGAGTVRFGVTDWLTAEGHVEGSAALLNGGIGSVFGIGAWGAGGLALAGSVAGEDTGLQASASLEVDLGVAALFGRTQRAFGEYQDIAAVSSEESRFDTRPVRTLEQVGLSFPLSFDAGSLSFSATHLADMDGEEDWVGALSYSRPMPRNSALFASAFVDYDERPDFGGYLGFSMPLGERMVNTGTDFSDGGVSAVADISRPESAEPGSYGWRVRSGHGGDRGASQAAGVSYRSRFARFEGGMARSSGGTYATAQMDGAVAIAGGGVFVANRINDAFAVVDAGAPGVDVLYENRPVGTTGRSGRLLVTDLRSYEPNKIAIDPANLPVDAIVPITEEMAVPADRSGITVAFGATVDAPSALVEFRDAEGRPIEAGSTGKLAGGADPFFVGYDGQAFLTGLGRQNVAAITRPDGAVCTARFDFAPAPGAQVQIPNVACVAQ